ncbi:hypothetical protein HMPREF3038_00477 [Akkermansia sp. KLE1797]|nr:hypothetical protein HMPREF3038_00477 [Akkermansia sp. KLE1797]KXU55605.1 hypothetical protein HMPREF3039_00162 [Akkermansia sp. KLE1798]KZA05464.1 hypothetical protein HMPREF1326_00871 [Akkermansia sp. KLE1605]
MHKYLKSIHFQYNTKTLPHSHSSGPAMERETGLLHSLPLRQHRNGHGGSAPSPMTQNLH